MKLPPLLRERSVPAQVVLAVVAPVALGALCGYLLGRSETAFNLVMLFAGVGGVASGFEHLGAREGAIRGALGGVLFTAALAICFATRGLPPLAQLPLPLAGMAVLYAAMGVPLGALGGRLRRRAVDRQARTASS